MEWNFYSAPFHSISFRSALLVLSYPNIAYMFVLLDPLFFSSFLVFNDFKVYLYSYGIFWACCEFKSYVVMRWIGKVIVGLIMICSIFVRFWSTNNDCSILPNYQSNILFDCNSFHKSTFVTPNLWLFTWFVIHMDSLIRIM